jgi:plasmid maintenance system antidote protein VapI
MMSRNPNRCPTHPGELLREDVLPEGSTCMTFWLNGNL